MRAHTDWLDHSPGGRALRRHGVDWRNEDRVLIKVWLEDELELDFKIGPDVVAFYGGTVDDEGTASFLCPPLLADELRWEEDEGCGWSLQEPWDVAVVANDGTVLAVGTVGEGGIIEFAGKEDAPST